MVHVVMGNGFVKPFEESTIAAPPASKIIASGQGPTIEETQAMLERFENAPNNAKDLDVCILKNMIVRLYEKGTTDVEQTEQLFGRFVSVQVTNPNRAAQHRAHAVDGRYALLEQHVAKQNITPTEGMSGCVNIMTSHPEDHSPATFSTVRNMFRDFCTGNMIALKDAETFHTQFSAIEFTEPKLKSAHGRFRKDRENILTSYKIRTSGGDATAKAPQANAAEQWPDNKTAMTGDVAIAASSVPTAASKYTSG